MTERQVPVTILTGFLGAGKTTLLRRILAQPQGRKFGILVNDFGEINIDSALVMEDAPDQISLSNGCVCCTIQADLVAAVRKMLKDTPDIDHILIEASGVSRSLPIADTIQSDELKENVQLDGVFCLVDAAGFPDLDYVTTELAIDQITGADMLILNKIDLVSEAELAALRQRIAGINPAIRVIPAIESNIPLDLLFGAHNEEPHASHHEHGHDHHDHVCGPDCNHHHHHDHHTDLFESLSWSTDDVLDEMSLRKALRALPASLLRAKGILRVATGNMVKVLEYQQVGRRNRLTPLDTTVGSGCSLVAIGRRGELDDAGFRALFDACERAQPAEATAPVS